MAGNDDELNPAELQVVRAACGGVWAEFQPEAKPTIRASLIRRLLLGHPVECDKTLRTCATSGVRIRRASISGTLDLSDCTIDGRALPSLQLEECICQGALNLNGARISRFSVFDSSFPELSLRGAEVHGSLDFRYAGKKDRHAVAFIDARAARVHGPVLGSHARLAAPLQRARGSIPFGEQAAALHFRDAEIGGTVILHNIQAAGGISFDTARVHGDVWAIDAELVAGETDPFRAQNATVEGSLILRGQTTSRGMIWLSGIRLRGSLDLAGARIFGRAEDGSRGPSQERIAIDLSLADIGAGVVLDQTRALGKISLAQTNIDGSVSCLDLQVFNRDQQGTSTAIDAYGMTVSGDMLLERATVAGAIGLENAEVGGRLSLTGSRIRNARRNLSYLAEPAGQATRVLSAVNVKIGKQAEISCPFDAFGQLDFRGAVIAGDFDLHGARIENWTANGDGTALNLERAVVQGSLRLDRNLFILGEINLLGCRVGRDLNLQDCILANGGRSAVFAKDVVVGGDMRLERSILLGGALRFKRAQVSGVVLWSRLHLAMDRLSTDPKPPAPLELTHAEIGTSIEADLLTCTEPSRIDLNGVRTSTLRFSWPSGWGGVGIAPEQFPIDLDGLQYSRILIPQWSPPTTQIRGLYRLIRQLHPPKEPLFGPFQEWLRRQHIPPGSVSTFFPQPYRQLVRVLRAQGEEGIARLIACREQELTPATGLVANGWKRVFGLFGFGLRPRPALFTTLIYLMVGAVGVYSLKQAHKLVETVVVASTLSVPMEQDDDLPKAQIPDQQMASAAVPEAELRRAILRGETSGAYAKEILCTDVANSFLDDIVYALDVVMPFISLHQETRCEITPGGGWVNVGLRALKAVYSFVGWIVVSLALVTFSGLLRRLEREPD